MPITLERSDKSFTWGLAVDSFPRLFFSSFCFFVVVAVHPSILLLVDCCCYCCCCWDSYYYYDSVYCLYHYKYGETRCAALCSSRHAWHGTMCIKHQSVSSACTYHSRPGNSIELTATTEKKAKAFFSSERALLFAMLCV